MSWIVMAALLLVRVSLSLLLRVSGVRLILTATTVAAVAGGVGSAATMPPRSLTAHAAHAHDPYCMAASCTKFIAVKQGWCGFKFQQPDEMNVELTVS